MKRPFALIRVQSGITLQRASILTGYSESHLRAVESGRAPLTQPLALALARAYGCEPREIVRPPAEAAR